MKKVYFLLLALVSCTLSFQSCDKDKEDLENNTASIIGKWRPIEMESRGKCIDNSPFHSDDWTEFYDNGTFKSYDGTEKKSSSGTWVMNGNIITIIDLTFPIPIPFEIKELNNKTLILHADLPCIGAVNSTMTTTYERL